MSRLEVIYLALQEIRAHELYVVLGDRTLFKADHNRAVMELAKGVDAALAKEVARRKADTQP